jgi:hypothetical protein
MVVGSSERAFYGAQFAQMAPLFAHYGVALWIADAGGAVDPGFLADDGLMTMLGMLSKREVIRARIRVQNAMTVQTAATPTPPKPQSTPTRNTGAQARPQNQ